MKFLISLSIVAISFSCLATPIKNKAAQTTKQKRTVAQADVEPGQKLTFYSCPVNKLEKKHCSVVSDISIGKVLAETDSRNTVRTFLDHDKDGELSYNFEMSNAQWKELMGKLKTAYSDHKSISVFFAEEEVKRLEHASMPYSIYKLEEADISIESN